MSGHFARTWNLNLEIRGEVAKAVSFDVVRDGKASRFLIARKLLVEGAVAAQPPESERDEDRATDEHPQGHVDNPEVHRDTQRQAESRLDTGWYSTPREPPAPVEPLSKGVTHARRTRRTASWSGFLDPCLAVYGLAVYGLPVPVAERCDRPQGGSDGK